MPATNNINGKIFGKEMDELKQLKRERLKAIMEFARTQIYVSQEATCNWLAERGCGCNQGQLSKDLADLDMAPYIDCNGNKRLGRRSSILSAKLAERYVKCFQEAVESEYRIDNNVILRVIPGFAQGVATVIESEGWPEVLGVYYGMFTVTIQCMDEARADDIYDRIKEGIL